MVKSKQTTTSFEKTFQMPDAIGGGTLQSLLKTVDPEDYVDGTEGVSTPSKSKYHESLVKFYDVMKFVIPLFLAIFLAISAFYLNKVREPIVRLEEKFVNVEKQVDVNLNRIEELQKLVYPILKK